MSFLICNHLGVDIFDLSDFYSYWHSLQSDDCFCESYGLSGLYIFHTPVYQLACIMK